METKMVSKLIEDLQTENGTYVERIMQLTMDVSRLKVQNDKYKEALEHIATLGNIFEEKASAQVAREALKGGE